MNPIAENFTVSARLIGGDVSEIVVDLMREAHPDMVVEDNGSYWSISVNNKDLVFDMDAISEALGYRFTVTSFLGILASYKGEIDVRDNAVVIKVFAPA
jgi:hypothetical protein